MSAAAATGALIPAQDGKPARVPVARLNHWERAVLSSEMSGRARALLLVLGVHLDRLGRACVGYPTLAREGGWKDPKSIRPLIAEAERAGLVHVKVGGTYGVGDATRWQATVPVGHPCLAEAPTAELDPAHVEAAQTGPGAALAAVIDAGSAARVAQEAAVSPARVTELNTAVQARLDAGWTLEELAQAVTPLPDEMKTVAGLLRYRVLSVYARPTRRTLATPTPPATPPHPAPEPEFGREPEPEFAPDFVPEPAREQTREPVRRDQDTLTTRMERARSAFGMTF